MNDLDLYHSGELAPYSAPSPGLPASSPAASPDYLTERTGTQGQPQLFGQVLPPGANQFHVEAAISQLAGIFATDAAQLGSGQGFIQQAVAAFKQLASQPVPHEPVQHSYNLSGLPPIPASDMPYVTAFANQMARVDATEKDVRNAVYWLGLLYQKLAQPQPQADRNASPVTDAEYRKVIKNNEQAIQSGQDELKARWSHQYESNMALVKKFFSGLSAAERERFETAVVDGRMALNHPDIIEGLYKQATARAPTNATGVEEEIKAIENVMRTDRKRYNADPAMQARLRDLYDLRGH